MSTFWIIYIIIGCIIGIFMYGVSMAGGNAKPWQYIAGLVIYPVVAQLYGPWLIFMIIGSILT